MSTLAICMMIKNESFFLPHTLPGLVDGADEVIITDTGSTDDSIAIATKLGANIDSVIWNNNFSDGKNHAINRASSDWILMVDADEYISTDTLSVIKKELHKSTATAYWLPIYECKQFDTQKTDVHLPRIKLFKNNHNIHYRGPIYEQLFHDTAPLQTTSHLPDSCYVCHWGGTIALTDEQATIKRSRYIQQLATIISDYPTEASYYYFLGIHYWNNAQHDEAYNTWMTLLKLKASDEIRIQTQVKIAEYLTYKMRPVADILPHLLDAITTSSAYPEPFVKLGSLYMKNFQLEKAKNAFTQALGLSPKNRLLSVDMQQYDYWPYYALGIIAFAQKRYQEANSYYQHALAHFPTPELKEKIKKITPYLKAAT